MSENEIDPATVISVELTMAEAGELIGAAMWLNKQSNGRAMTGGSALRLACDKLAHVMQQAEADAIREANYDGDSPESHEEAALGALILADAMETNGLPTMGSLMRRPDARKLIGEARERVLAKEGNDA